MNLEELVRGYEEIGFKREFARVKVCQDIIFQRISSSNFNKNITVKGGAIMYHLTNELRRTTADLDIDLIRLSISSNNLLIISYVVEYISKL